jgi:F-type H+-transporting ATPase subunit epsilon
MDKQLTVEIVTPSKVIYTGMANSVKLPGSKSPFQVLYNHAPIVSALDSGNIVVDQVSGGILNFKSSTGFAEVNKNKVTILVEKAEL